MQLNIKSKILSDKINACGTWKQYYLIWFKNQGYCLITYNMDSISIHEDDYKDNEFFVKRYVTSKAYPHMIKEKDNAAYEELVKYVDIFLERFYKAELDNNESRWKGNEENPERIIDELLENITNHITQETNHINSIDDDDVKEIYNKGFKEYYNISDSNEARKQYNETVEVINTHIEDMTSALQKNQFIAKNFSTKELGIEKPINYTAKAIQEIETAVKYNNNPLYSLYNNPSKQKTILLASKQLEEELNIKRVVVNGGARYYYYNNEYYEEIDDISLTSIIRNRYGFNFRLTTARALLEAIVNDNVISNDYLLAKNGLIDKRTGKIDKTINTKDILVLDKIAVKKHDSNNIILLEFNENATAHTETNTLVQKSLKEITIEKGTSNEDIYIDRLQRFGNNLLGRNDKKTIAFYINREHNTGKSGLRVLNELLLNDNVSVIGEKEFDDSLNYNVIGNNKAILIDETRKGQLEKNLDSIKLISSPNPRRDCRKMYTDLKITIERFGNLEIYSNHSIELSIHEDAVFHRIDAIKLPNHFVETENELNTVKNSYLVNPKLYNELANDFEGLSWLASASINEVIKMENEKLTFKCRQTAAQTREILSSTDDLTSFLYAYTEFNEDGNVLNKDIKQAYIDFLSFKGKFDIVDNDKLASEIGLKLNTLYGSGIKAPRAAEGTRYRIKLKSINEVELDFKYAYVTNEDNLTERQLEILSNLSSDKKTVFNNIKQGKNNTINKLNSTLYSIDCYNTVKELESLGLIRNTFNTAM